MHYFTILYGTTKSIHIITSYTPNLTEGLKYTRERDGSRELHVCISVMQLYYDIGTKRVNFA